MTIQWGDTGRAVFGSYKTLNMPINSVEYLFGTTAGAPYASAQALPTASPANGAVGDVSFTISAANLPILSSNINSVTYTAILIVAGKNTDAASQTVTYQCYKNGTSISGATGSGAVASNTFWTFTHCRFFGVVAGDTIEVKTWATSTNVNYDYIALMIYPTRVIPTKALMQNVTMTLTNPSLSVGVPSAAATNGFVFYPFTDLNNFNMNGTGTVQSNALALGSSSFGSMGKIWFGDNSQTSALNTHASNRPYYLRNIYPSQITFREILR